MISPSDLLSITNYVICDFFREVEMAHKVLAKDMHELVSAMRLAEQYSDTTLDVEYRKFVLLSTLKVE